MNTEQEFDTNNNSEHNVSGEEAHEVPETPEEEHEAVTIEEEDDGGEQKITKLRKKLKQCEAERQEYLAGWQRAKADIMNERAQHKQELDKTAERAKGSVVEALLPALDSFEMAFADTETWERADEQWRTGVEQIYQQLLAALKQVGVTPVRPLGEPFDPTYHESAAVVPAEAPEQDNTVVEVLQTGYRMGERVIRPARVHVAHADTANDDDPDSNTEAETAE